MNKEDKDGIESKHRSGTRSMGRRFILEQSDSPSAAEGIQRDCRADTLTSLADDMAVTRNLLAAQKGLTIPVGHSYAGVVISGAANDSPSVEALVYIAAFGLDEDESIDALSKQGPAPAGATAVGPPDEHGFLWIDRVGFGEAFAADADSGQSPRHGCSAKASQHQFVHREIRTTGLETSPVVVHGPTEDQMNLPQAEEFYGKENGRHGPQSTCESCSHGFSP